jgi:mono/diheme cytochrome c family protein
MNFSIKTGALLIFAFLSLSNYLPNGETIFQTETWVAPKSADALKNPLKSDEAATATGQQLFSTVCFVCHGNQGKGDGISAAALAKKPADLTSAKVQRQSDGAIFWKITEGNPPMLRFKESLSEEQRWSLVNYVRKLGKMYGSGGGELAAKKPGKKSSKKKEPKSKAKPEAAKAATTEAIASTPPAANPFEGMDGKTLFRSICGACHTVGKGKLIGPDLKGVSGRYSKDWLFKWVRSSQSLVKAGDPDAVRLFEENYKIVMPDQPSLTDEQISSVFTYIDGKSKPKEIATTLSLASNTGTTSRVQVATPKANVTFSNSRLGTYFLYLGFAFVLVALLSVTSLLSKMIR